jgi:tRNA A-37 threonylcarbamoyl transferase component Bud32
VTTSRSDEPATVDLAGRCVGGSYILVCPVGQGATGTVWRGVDRTTGTQVAVKLLHEGLLRQPKLVTRFVQERTILMMVRHEHIVGVRDLFSVGESLGLVMDFVAGGSLRERLRSGGPLEPAEAARLTGQVAAALAEAHALGVVHRDVKPDNILLHLTGDRADVRLTDFGIARIVDAAGLTTPHAIIGTPHYMAPEAIGGATVGPPADVYALGIVLYELIGGRPPYTGEAFDVLRGHVDDEPPRPPGMPDAAWSVIRSCLGKDPEARPPAAELATTLHELARLLADVPALPAPASVMAAEPAAHPSVVRPARRLRRNGPRTWKWERRAMIAVLVAGALAASGWGGYRAWRPGETSAAPGAAGAGPAHGSVSNGSLGLRPAQSGTPARAAGPGAALPSGATSPPPPAAGANRGADFSAAPGPAGTRTHPGQAGGSAEFGPWHCADWYSWDLGNPVQAKPCYALGDAVRVEGYMESPPGIQVDISMSLRNADTGDVAAGPSTCSGLTFTALTPKQSCGPVDLQAPKGHRYVVVETWRYTGGSMLPGGTVSGPEFTW